MVFIQSEGHPKKTVAFDVDQVQRLKDDEHTIHQKEDEEMETAATIKNKSKKTEEQNSTLTGKLIKDKRKKVHLLELISFQVLILKICNRE